MKLSKTSWLILTSSILIVAFVSVGAARSQKIDEQNRIQEELTVAELRLSKLQLDEFSAQLEELEEQLSQIISQSKAIEDALSLPTENIAASGTLFDIAETSGVEITEIGSSEPVRDDLEGITYSALPFTVRVEGDTSSLNDFTIALNDNFKTGAVKSVEINIPEAIEDGGETGEEPAEGETEELERPSASIRLVIYTYQGG